MRHRAGALGNHRWSVVIDSLFAGGPGGDVSRFRVRSEVEQAELWEELLAEFFAATPDPPKGFFVPLGSVWAAARGEAAKPAGTRDVPLMLNVICTVWTPPLTGHAAIPGRDDAGAMIQQLVERMAMARKDRDDDDL